MTPQTIITAVRYLYNDSETDPSLQRKLDAELLGYVNEGIKEISILVPNLFNSIRSLTCTAGAVEQTLAFADAQAIVDVPCIHGAGALTVFDWDTMNQFRPGWRADTAGPAKQWCRRQGDPLRFFIYPPAPVSQTLDVMYVHNPTDYALTDTITELPYGYAGALVDYVVYRAESSDDEHSNSGRAAASYQAFTSKLGVKGA